MEKLFRDLVETIDAVLYVFRADDPSTPPLYVSPAVERIYGYPLDDVLRMSQIDMYEWIHPEDRGWMIEQMTGSADVGTFQAEYRTLCADGTYKWTRNTSRLVPGTKDRPPLWCGVGIDISASKAVEEALRTSETRYRVLVEQVPAVVYEMGPDDERRTLYVSPHVEEILGYTRQEWLDQLDIWTELLHPDDREIELAAHDRHNETGEPWRREYRLIASDGRVVWVRDQAVLVRDEAGHPSTWQGVMLDVTAQKELEDRLRRANDELEFRVLERTAELEDANELMGLEIGERRRVEDELREAHERWRQLVERIPAAVYIWDVAWADGGVPTEQYVSPQIEEMVGFSPREWVRDQLWEARIHPHDRDRVLKAARESESTGVPFSEEYRLFAKDGDVVWVLDQATLLSRDELGRTKLLQGVMLDISARKEAEARAAEAEERYGELVERLPGMTYLWEVGPDRAERPDRYNSPQLERLFGFAPSEWQASVDLWKERLHPDDRERVIAATRRSEASGEPFRDDYRVIAKDGRVVWVHDEASVIQRDERGQPRMFQGFMMDVTERKEEERRLREAEERHRALVEELPAVPFVQVVDLATGTSRFTYIGPQCESVLGWTADELQAEPDHFTRMLHPEDQERLLARLADVDRTGEQWDEEFRQIAKDGRVVWIHSIARVADERHGTRTWRGLVIDVTSRKERESAATEGEPAQTRAER